MRHRTPKGPLRSVASLAGAALPALLLAAPAAAQVRTGCGPIPPGGSGSRAPGASSHAAQAAGTPSHSSTCPGGNARDNTYSPPYEVGIDYVPVTTDDSLGFHVVYSGKDDGTGTGASLNSNIFVFALTDGGILIFGGGYGDPSGPYTALNDADYDVANIDLVVRQCLGLDPATAPVDFVWPHWHADHGSDEFVHSLEDAGYTIRSIAFQEGDSSYVYGYGWYPEDYAKFVEFPDGACNTEIASYQTTLGKAWFTSRPGHTAGSIDLVLDVRDNVNDRFLIHGSVPGTQCTTLPPGTQDVIEVHNNVILTGQAQAVPYGCVGPAGSLTLVSGTPKPNQLLTFGIDDPTGSLPSGAASFLLVSSLPDPAIPCGALVKTFGTPRTYELLVDLPAALAAGSPLAGGTWPGPGSPALISARIPPDQSLKGTSLYVQGFLLNPGGGASQRLALTDAIELRIR